MPDIYVTRIRQVVKLLGYGEPHVLEVFKNTVPNRLYWVLFPIYNLCEAVETAKRFLTKEKIDRQMTGQSSTPFMKLSDKKSRKTVSFDARDVLERNNNRGYERGRGHFRRGGFWGRTSSNFRRNDSRDRNREDRRPWRQSRSRERGIRARSESSSRSRLNSRTSTNRDRVQCFKCREYDHFANECPNLVPNDLDRESDGARSASLQILADSDMDSKVEQYLNI